MFETEFCKVEYLPDIDAVLCSWKKYCDFDDYREPLKYGLKLIDEHHASTWITDTTHGFETALEDNQWLASDFTPQAINSSCKKVIFIIKNDSPFKEEIELHTQLLEPFFEVTSVERLADI